jgi:predicted DNA repair protein MutK
VTSDFAIATVLLGGGSLAASTVNVVSPSLVSEVAGLLVGGGAILHGMNHLDQNRGTKRVANASIITGSVSIATSVGSYIRSRMRAKAVERRVSRVVISPTVTPVQSTYRLGLAATASF